MAKYFNIPVALLFLLMAVIQLNDPDPLYWVVVYVAASSVAGAKAMSIKHTTLSYITIGLVLAGLLSSVSGTVDYLMAGNFKAISGQMSGDKPYIESAREFGGLLIVVMYFGLGAYLSKNFPKKHT